ncbi:nuclear transport factor 2 family protein [Phytoactinopolyspora mesophila]|uniref:Nuclear transport factor 2 family protein n=1 Tax=Phytoactinopolyspora mesophila TaxID=2650750 RepID=A0A7K3M658_9ACTN|nr:nuclear transport factor 2 family protein [Phytoactinopolyspora mesophila]NDL58382.1 nuclear transport factor 2 family protein [Phytoactinopolyspora mesophila]
MTGEKGDTVTDLLGAYISVWNERNPQTRQTISDEVFTPDAYYVDPNTSAQGRSAIDTYVAGWQEQFPDFVFVLGEVRSHHDVAHFGWSFGPTGGPPAASGGDVVVIERGRISKIYGFFD